MSEDTVNHPSHYTTGAIEVIDAIEAWHCDFLEGNIIKYIARWRHKGGLEDLKKAQWYMHRLVAREEVPDTKTSYLHIRQEGKF